MVNGAPAAHAQFVPVIVPTTGLAVESPTDVPVPSFNPQRPTSPAALVISTFLFAWISDAVSARFQTRASSMTPSKKLAAAPVEVSAVPIAAYWFPAAAGGWLMVSSLSRTPSRKSCHFLPSYVAAAWCHVLLEIVVTPR